MILTLGINTFSVTAYSAQQRTAANATKKRVMPNQVNAQTLISDTTSTHSHVAPASVSLCFCLWPFLHTSFPASYLHAVSVHLLSSLLICRSLFLDIGSSSLWTQGEILVSTIPPHTFLCHFLFCWVRAVNSHSHFQEPDHAPWLKEKREVKGLTKQT